MISKALLESLVRKHGTNTGLIYADIEKYEKIRKAIKTITDKQHQARETCEQTIKNLQKETQTILETCDHPDTTHHPDPSGNNDSYTSCNICGKEWAGRPKVTTTAQVV